MRIPDPIANTTTEAYLAYKAGVLAEGDLKPKLYDPYIHLDAWLAYWAGLTTTYPVKGVGKNLFRGGKPDYTGQSAWVSYGSSDYTIVDGGYNLPDRYNAIAFEYDNLVEGEEYVFSADYVGNTTFFFSVGVNMYSGGSSLPRSYKDYGTKTTSQRLSFKFTASATNRIGFNSGYTSGNTLTLTNIQLERSSTPTAYEPYTGEPEMLTDEEALIAYLSGVTNTYPEEFRDPADVRVAAYLKYLVSARWGRPEYPVTNEELYLSMMDAPYIPAGEPSSDIEIDDTAEAPFKDVKMYGDTSQTTYTGKNMFNLATPATNNGVTVTANADGSFTLNGTTTGVANFNFILPDLKPAGTYTISCTSKNQVMDDGFFVRARKQDMSMLVPGSVDGPSQIRGTGSNYVEKTFVSTDPMYCLALNLTTTGVTYDNMVIYPQVEVGGTATDWERYVGGVPAPNPDYPQAVNTVTGRQVVKVKGKNLLEVASGEDTQNKSTITISNGDINYTASASGESFAAFGIDGSSIRRTNYGDYVPWGGSKLGPGTYTLSVRYISGSTTTVAGSGGNFLDIFIYGREVGSTGRVNSQIAKASVNTTDQTATFTLTEEKEVNIVAYMYANSPSVDINFNVQFEKGSTATDFTPYQSGEYEINLGKNLLDNTLQATTTYAGTITTIDGSTWTVVKPSNGGISLTPRTDFLPVNIKAGESVTFSSYPVSGVVSQSSVHYQIRCYFYDKDENLLDNISTTTTANDIMAQAWSTSYTPTVDVAYIKLGYYVPSNAGTTDGVTLHLQLERGSTPTSYAPYFTPIELCKIGDYQDYIYENDGKWKIHKEVGKSLVDTSLIQVWGAYDNIEYAQIYKPSDAINFGNYSHKDGKCTHAVWSANTSWDSASNNGKIYDGANALYYWLGFAKGTGVDNVKSALSGCVIDYPLATATDTEITNTALIDQLNALKNGGSYTGTTYIKVSATDPNLPGLLEVEAYKYD